MTSAAQAATRTFEAIFTDLVDNDGGLVALGAAGATEMAFAWSFDDAALPFIGPTGFVSSGSEIVSAHFHYLALSVSIGSTSFQVTDLADSSSEFTLSDGVVDGSTDVADSFRVQSGTVFDGPNGTQIFEIIFWALDYDHTIFGHSPDDPNFSGLVHPTAEQLNALEYSRGGEIGLSKDGVDFYISSQTVEVHELTAVSLPASLSLLAGAMVALVGLRRRRDGLGSFGDRCANEHKAFRGSQRADGCSLVSATHS